MRKGLILAILIFVSLARAGAQELNCKIEVMHDRIQNTDPKVFQSMKRALTEFLNNRKWTSDSYKPQERIECSFMLNLTEKSSENIYRATLNIQASRPVFNTNYNSSLVNFIDRDIVFRYDETQVLTFDDNRVSGPDALASNLTAVFAYYTYLILGLDYDSFAPKGGSEFLKRAQNVVNNAPEEGKTIGGWKAADGNRNRYWIIDQLLSPRFEGLRSYWYNFHRLGLDMMSQNPEEARKKILEGIPSLTKINNENPSSILFQFIFNAKSSEFINVLAQTPAAERKDYADQLGKMDVPNVTKYKNIR